MSLEPIPAVTDLARGQADGLTDIAAEPTPQSLRLQKLFRHTLKAGEVNPLLLIVPLYHQEADE